MPIIEPSLGEQVADAMRARGIHLRTGAGVTGFALDDAGRVAAVQTDDGAVPADLVILGLGVTARSALAADAGLPLGRQGRHRRRRPAAGRGLRPTSGRPATASSPRTG